ncbi:hypothetical protein [Thioalkalivibrio sp. ALE16]|uniref:hypothetical protein n=1 Tax=Thioalkalivibrio sp. ALE16 TaxID=1158172 RepID=UPI00037F2687|nr:hypothetical protein [Thioalkalivibrio sp. ALE16]
MGNLFLVVMATLIAMIALVAALTFVPAEQKARVAIHEQLMSEVDQMHAAMTAYLEWQRDPATGAIDFSELESAGIDALKNSAVMVSPGVGGATWSAGVAYKGQIAEPWLCLEVPSNEWSSAASAAIEDTRARRAEGSLEKTLNCGDESPEDTAVNWTYWPYRDLTQGPRFNVVPMEAPTIGATIVPPNADRGVLVQHGIEVELETLSENEGSTTVEVRLEARDHQGTWSVRDRWTARFEGYIEPFTIEDGGFIPPGQGGTPPGQGGTPPGQGGTPPGQGGTPPGQGGTPPGQGGTPPGQGGTPPGQGGTPPGQTRNTPDSRLIRVAAAMLGIAEAQAQDVVTVTPNGPMRERISGKVQAYLAPGEVYRVEVETIGVAQVELQAGIARVDD